MRLWRRFLNFLGRLWCRLYGGHVWEPIQYEMHRMELHEVITAWCDCRRCRQTLSCSEAISLREQQQARSVESAEALRRAKLDKCISAIRAHQGKP